MVSLGAGRARGRASQQFCFSGRTLTLRVSRESSLPPSWAPCSVGLPVAEPPFPPGPVGFLSLWVGSLLAPLLGRLSLPAAAHSQRPGVRSAVSLRAHRPTGRCRELGAPKRGTRAGLLREDLSLHVPPPPQGAPRSSSFGNVGVYTPKELHGTVSRASGFVPESRVLPHLIGRTPSDSGRQISCCQGA